MFLWKNKENVFSHANAYKIESSLCLVTVSKIDPMLLLMWDKRSYIQDKLHATFDVMTFQIMG